ncbi:MAG: RdgB/HAM1 family non-canonical purine NTP pyrophosphatase [Spirochaetes bacterium]|nr:RdgB/HAM1 family non-canonical purine NTP pyrophosphatase [Spirochaetota bacterium]MBN2769102.1 RdgB/HAM1 family non-canonical purine NTP pyrophosphatase [Spirochaetota bacterium]
MIEIITASTNSHKINEMNNIAGSSAICKFTAMSRLDNYPENIIEDGNTFKENALIKAKALTEYTDKPIIADDSGLVIDALNGEPGIFSARYHGLESDNEKNRLILELLKDVADKERTARFVCLLAFIDSKRNTHFFEGACEGMISKKIIGGNGFGYDPIFYVSEYKTTMANVAPETKNRISHRALALQNFLEFMKNMVQM